MLDYYGSITMEEKNINKDILQVFKQYQTKYIQTLLHKLRKEEILSSGHSISGYQIFVRKIIIDSINQDIKKKTVKNNKKLIFTHSYFINYHNIDILCKILESYSTISDK